MQNSFQSMGVKNFIKQIKKIKFAKNLGEEIGEILRIKSNNSYKK